MTVLPQLPLYTTRWQYSVVYKLCDQLYTLKRRISLMVINPYSWTLRQHFLPKLSPWIGRFCIINIIRRYSTIVNVFTHVVAQSWLEGLP